MFREISPHAKKFAKVAVFNFPSLDFFVQVAGKNVANYDYNQLLSIY
jgi:hypothetical protein